MSLLTRRTTVETYSKIRQLGLPTLEWREFTLEPELMFTTLASVAEPFIRRYNPCLFIWDPKDPTPKNPKGFILNVNQVKPVAQWAEFHRNTLPDYRFLLSTQISNNPDTPLDEGFVGSIYSDGEGNLFGETYHKPGVHNQRELTRPREITFPFLTRFSFEEFEPRTVQYDGMKALLTPHTLHQLSYFFGARSGYFEFVSGEHLGRRGIYTMGFLELDKLPFPYREHEAQIRDPSAQLEKMLV